jgi:predicted nuclease of restriction endonuclease-like (RecB) superfamily
LAEQTEAVDHKVLTLRFDFEDYVSKSKIKDNGTVEFIDKMGEYMEQFKEINNKNEQNKPFLVLPSETSSL